MHFPSLAPDKPRLAPGHGVPAATEPAGPAGEAGLGQEPCCPAGTPVLVSLTPRTALSLEAASGVSGSYLVSESPVSPPASQPVGVLGLMSSFTPLRVAGPSQGSTETLDPDSARSSPFEERRRRVKEDGKVNAPTLPALAARARGLVPRGTLVAPGLKVAVPGSHHSWRSKCSARWETRRWWHRRGAVLSPRGSAPARGCWRWVGLQGSSSFLWEGGPGPNPPPTPGRAPGHDRVRCLPSPLPCPAA